MDERRAIDRPNARPVSTSRKRSPKEVKMAETVPPLTIKQLEDSLNNQNFSSYVFIGATTDTGWKMAIAAQKILPALRVYLIDQVKAAEVRAKFNVPQECISIVFGWTADVKRMLTKSEAEDFFTVTDAITAGRS
jgi:hypothetical protein